MTIRQMVICIFSSLSIVCGLVGILVGINFLIYACAGFLGFLVVFQEHVDEMLM